MIDAQIHVTSLEQLRREGVMVVQGADRAIAVFADGERVRAVDNRCPHLGFPLHKGTVQDGILICHWHHARFDLCSGCTFDMFADDVPPFDVDVRDGEVYVSPNPRHDMARNRLLNRLQAGLEQNVPLIQAKALLSLLETGEEPSALVREVALFGCSNRDTWLDGLTSLTAATNLIPDLDFETAFLALYQGTRRVAANCVGMPPRRRREPLESDEGDTPQLGRWLHQFTQVRHRDGAERTVLTVLHGGATPEELTRLLFAAVLDRYYAATGHLLDFCNKACELLELIGWKHADAVLPSLMEQLAEARGGEELNQWRYPVDLLEPISTLSEQLPTLFEAARGSSWLGDAELTRVILGDDPLAILSALKTAIQAGATPTQLSRTLSYAAAVRLARFSTVNEFRDWITALHTITYCNAVHQMLSRCAAPDLVRGVVHGAIAVYHNRFLNVPPAHLPGPADHTETDPRTLLASFLTSLDQRAEVEQAARIVATYLGQDHPVGPLIDTMARATVREDFDFHTLQCLEAAVRQYREWAPSPEANVFLIAAARYTAAHSPTERGQLQTAEVALRLNRGEALHEDAPENDQEMS